MLSRISIAHYHDLKGEVFNLLIQMFEEDPITPSTAVNLLKLIIDLNGELVLSKIQLLTIPFQKKMARAFSATVELYLRHYNKADHVNAITDKDKQLFLETQKSFAGLNTKENQALEFYHSMALEASKRLTSDTTVFWEVIERLTHFATSLGKAYEKDIGGFLSEFSQVFIGLQDKIKGEWFETLFVMRDLVQKAPDNMKKAAIILSTVATTKAKHDWKFIYGSLEILMDIVSQTQDIKVLEIALAGIPTKLNMKEFHSIGSFGGSSALTLTASITQLVLPKAFGAVDLLEFNGYVQKAFIASSDDKKASKTIRTKAKELCELLIKKLSSTYEGRKLLLGLYDFSEKGKSINEKALRQYLGSTISSDSKRRLEWLGVPTPISPKELPPAAKAVTIPTALWSTDVKIKEGILVAQTSTSGATKEPMLGFYESVIQGKAEIVQKHLSENKNLTTGKDPKGNTALILAAREGHVQICEILMKAGFSPLTRGEKFRNALHHAAAAGKLEIVKLFSTEKILLNSVDENNKTPLMLAAEQGHSAVCAILLDRQTDSELKKISLEVKDKDSNTALILAAKAGHSQVCNVLIKAGANRITTDLLNRNVLHWAVQGKNIELVTILSEFKDLLDSKSKQGSTPLIMAAGLGLMEICEILIANRANLQMADEEGRNAMHAAANEGSAGVVRLLLPYKELLNSRNKFGSTPFIIAAHRGHLEICEMLLKAGADPLVVREDGLNAMHAVALNGKGEVVKMLLAYKQLFDSKLKTGHTPLIWQKKAIRNLRNAFEGARGSTRCGRGWLERYALCCLQWKGRSSENAFSS